MRIVMHTRHASEPGGRHRMEYPWHWWRIGLRPCPDGSLFHQCYDDPRNIQEMSLLFNLLEMDEIIDPPAMHLVELLPEYDQIRGGTLSNLGLARGPSACIDVVWYERPGEHWEPLSGDTCLPGHYEMMAVERHLGHHLEFIGDCTRQLYRADMPPLQWDWLPIRDLGPFQFPRDPPTGTLLGIPPFMASRAIALIPGPVGPPPQSNYINPEDRVLDEIDQLVNNQIAPGPRDDYNVDKFPKCTQCPHTWHGLDCERCGCINTEWLEKKSDN